MNSNSKELAPLQSHSLEMVDLTKRPTINLTIEYWSPQTIGEFKNCVVLYVGDVISPSYNDPKVGVELRTLVIAAQENGVMRRYKNSSKLLVSTIEDALNAGEILPNQTWLKITYLGERRNKTNSFKSRMFSVELYGAISTSSPPPEDVPF
ncbi:hypothetical protein UFOVP81_7 [uncultured Caudovirales phage]|uniref:Uncharacterized protein n=1 Tax=uncultured Caudovirales phage TaxID=2100421 RepID=A0A6J5L272_9CAUD|nr:hypothetical protein UFOVP81_7 [uncultured Caudovirales phage]